MKQLLVKIGSRRCYIKKRKNVLLDFYFFLVNHINSLQNIEINLLIYCNYYCRIRIRFRIHK